MDSSKSSTSVMFAIAGDGSLLPTYVCYKSTNVYDTWILNGPPGAAYNRSKPGWFTREIFEDWIEWIDSHKEPPKFETIKHIDFPE